MPSYISLSNVPLLKLLVPAIFGILIAEFFQSLLPLYITSVLALLLFLLWLLFRTLISPYRTYLLPQLVVFMLSLAVGQMAWHSQEDRMADSQSIRATRFVATLLADAEPTEDYVRCEVKLLHGLTTLGETITLTNNAILYMAIDSASIALCRGDYVVCRGELSPITNVPNPDSFDYATYMRHCGYTLSQYLASDEWYSPPVAKEFSLSYRVNLARAHLLQRLDSCDLEPSQRALLSSLLLGYRNDITASQQEAFASAGLSHILAVSGLHTAIVLFLLFILLSPLSMMGAKKVQIVCVIGLLWLYAFLVGLPASVIRVAIMTTTILVGRVIGRRHSALNALALAALAMLLYDAHQLFLIGFQLSFVATFSILLLQPLMMDFLPQKQGIVYFLCSLLTVTLAAQLGTLPLVLYYFHQLPLWSLFTNILVVPFLPLVIGAGALLLLLLFLQLPSLWLVSLLNKGVGGINSLAAYVANSRSSSIDGIYLEPSHVWLCFVALALLYLTLRYRRISYLLLLLGGGIGYFVWSSYISPPTTLTRGWIVYHDTHYTAIQLLDDDANFILLADSLTDVHSIERSSDNFRLKNRLPSPCYVTDTLRIKDIWVEMPYLLYHDKRMVVVNSELPKVDDLYVPLYVDYCIVSKGYSKGGLKRLQQHYNFAQLIVTANSDFYTARYLVDDCREEGIPCYDMRDKGAWVEW